jgi:hypothetical protein
LHYLHVSHSSENFTSFPITFDLEESGWNGGKEWVLPHIIGCDIDLTEVRAVADLARAEEWDDIFSAVFPRLEDRTPRHEVASRENVIRNVSNKLATLSPYLALIGLVSVVSAAVAFRRRKA